MNPEHRPLPRPRALVPTLLALALAAVFVAPSIARAKCMAGNLSAWPPPDTQLTARPLILLEGFGNEQPHIAALAEGGTARLVAGKSEVALTVDAINIGAFGLTQAALTPAEDLEPATRYTLALRGADGQPVRTTQWESGESVPIGWTTAEAGSKRAPLTLDGTPLVTGQNFRRLGCGPASHVQVSLPARADGPIAVEVKLKELSGDAPAATYIVPVDGGVLRLGHGMCSGAFRLTGPERRFRAELTVRDANGDAVAAPAALEFDGVDPMGAFRKIQLE